MTHVLRFVGTYSILLPYITLESIELMMMCCMLVAVIVDVAELSAVFAWCVFVFCGRLLSDSCRKSKLTPTLRRNV